MQITKASLKMLHFPIPTMWHFRNGRTMETMKGSEVSGSLRRGREGGTGRVWTFRAIKLLCMILYGKMFLFNTSV